jgi:hypothetical protein
MSKIVIALGIVLVALLAVAVSASPVPQQAGTPLKDVGDLLVGSWTGEGTYAADYPGLGKKGEKFTSTYTCRWVSGQAAIECEGVLNKSTSATFYWWNAGSKQVKYIGMDSSGRCREGTITKQGAKLAWEAAGSFADGRRFEAKGESTFQDNGNTRIEAGAVILNGVRNEYRDTYKRVLK